MFFRISITIAGVIVTLVLSITLAIAQSTGRSITRLPSLPPAQPGQSFQDPHGRYRLSIPSGWQLSQIGDEPSFHNGSSWIQVRTITAHSPSDAVDRASAMFRLQFTTFNTINRGNTTIGGHASHGLNVDATTTGGQRMSVLLIAQSEDRKQYFVLVSATPLAQAVKLNTSVMALANSVRFSGE